MKVCTVPIHDVSSIKVYLKKEIESREPSEYALNNIYSKLRELNIRVILEENAILFCKDGILIDRVELNKSPWKKIKSSLLY